MRTKILLVFLVAVGVVALVRRGAAKPKTKPIVVKNAEVFRDLAAVPPADVKTSTNWPQFRGTRAAGFAEGFKTATEWDVPSSKNVKWKTPIEGLGHSSPIIWGDRVYVTTAVTASGDMDLRVGLYGDVAPVEDTSEHVWKVIALNKHDGSVIWEVTAHEGVPKIKRHTKATHANSTPATDGQHIVAFFGSEGLHCYDTDGKLLWKKDFGVLDSGWYTMPEAQWGFASSPVIYKDMVIVQCDVQKGSFLAALSIKDGSEIWRVPREDVPTWSTPTVYAEDGRPQIIVNGYRHIGGYDVSTGESLWKLAGGGDIPVPTPIVSHDLIFTMSAHGRKAPTYAIKTTARGDITPAEDQTKTQHLAWSSLRGANYMQTPIVYGDFLYGCRDNGVLTCREADTGKTRYRKRLAKGLTGFTASAVAADGKIYFTGEEGIVVVVKAGPIFGKMASNDLGDVCMATPAISEGSLFFRTQHHLIAIAQ